MKTADLAAATTLGDDLDGYADLIEAQIERSGRRGMSPARAARAVRCTTAEASLVLAHLVGRQRAHTTGTWKHIYPSTNRWKEAL